jgi:hypothetical protein
MHSRDFLLRSRGSLFGRQTLLFGAADFPVRGAGGRPDRPASD